ncbi:hypothetical protein B0T19DRAFT_425982 [Cercophora scortea]|uniref:NOT2/NOT3/NOT5 C-terminal domain-containing protein n=1 Tax=Cercophora scortea TaxID=314031 RepID=A0AAE0IEI2_9PEZI|nr:hypothetical protein B0T19DRAFT_425982 [Cercophora scortea]
MMNRPGAIPQPIRGIHGGFGGQQQPPQQQQQSNRAVSNRLPNGKPATASAASGWTFGAGAPMGGSSSALPPGSARQLGGNVSFAQSLSGSQPATPLDLSEFPSLSNNSQLTTSNQSTMWSSSGSRNLSGAVQRGGTPLSSQQTQQDDLFSTSRLPSAQGAFRFGNQGNSTQPQPQPPQTQANPADDFPPLNRNPNGEIGGQERGAGLIGGLGFGSGSAMNPSRAGNGLLNALSANSRATEARSPTAVGRPQDPRSPVEDEARQKAAAYREDGLASRSSVSEASAPALSRNPLGAIGNDPPAGKVIEEENGRVGEEVKDPLADLIPIDKWGLKGLRTLMNNFPDYNALTCGIDPSTLGLDLNSTELFSTQIYSLFEDTAPRPAVPQFDLPDCYQVKNVQPVEAKIQSFNEETLMWIFYSCPGDVKQQLAAIELHTRNWRWHKKQGFWLTKDDVMTPQTLGPGIERGYYIVWDTVNWRKERREFTLLFGDLDNTMGGGMVPGVMV